MEEPVLCYTCNCWVDCGQKDGERYGFCLCKDLYTYTRSVSCSDYVKDEPLTEEAFENLERI